VSLANHLNINVIAEGVETKDQLDFLRDINCHHAQAYYFSHPIDIEGVQELLRKGHIWNTGN